MPTEETNQETVVTDEKEIQTDPFKKASAEEASTQNTENTEEQNPFVEKETQEPPVANKEDNRAAYAKRKADTANQKVADLETKLAALEEKFSTQAPAEDIDSKISEAVKANQAQVQQKAEYEAKEQSALDMLHNQDYWQDVTARNEIINMIKGSPDLQAMHKADPNGAAELADHRFRQSKGLGANQMAAANKNALRSDSVMPGGKMSYEQQTEESMVKDANNDVKAGNYATKSTTSLLNKIFNKG